MKTWRVTYLFLGEERDVIVRADGYVQSCGEFCFYTHHTNPRHDDIFTAGVPNVIWIKDATENPTYH